MDERSVDVKTDAIDISEAVYFFVTAEGGVHLQSKENGGVITLSKKELERLKKLTDRIKSLEVMYGRKR